MSEVIVSDVIKYILEIVICTAMVIVVRYLIPWLKSKIEQSEYKWLYDIIVDAVQYAEQTVHGSKAGEEKKNIVQLLINDALKGKNIGINEEQINAMIESIVFEMNKEAA
jgi:LL-H family phage holin